MTSRMAGQTINDRFLAAKHSIAGQGLAKSVCKATTEEMIGPKKKHLDYLVHCTNEPNVSIPQLANLLIERSQNANWIVVYKALVTVHHIMCYGNERFTQYLASSNCTFQLSNFFDKSGVQGTVGARTGYDMSPFIRRYARYLNEKALAYRSIAFDLCKVKRGKEDGLLRTMNAEKILKTLPCLQSQLDILLEFDCSANDLSNGVINMCFMLLFRDLIRLFACYNDGIINLLEKYFDMNRKQCKEGLDIYKKFLIRMDRVAEFLRVAENVGIDKGDIPDLTKAPSSLLDALEQHLASLEGKKTSTTSSTPSQSSSTQKNIRSGMSALSSTSTAFGTVVANGRLDSHPNGIDDQIKQQLLAEEEAAMHQFKLKVNSPNSANNPFLSNSTNDSAFQPAAPTLDFLENEPVPPPAANKTSDDLLQLGNPFAQAFAPAHPPAQPNNIWIPNGNSYGKQPVITNGAFVTESSFASVFGTTETKTAEDPNQSSFNPFLVDDPTPSLFVDTDSPLSEHKPIKAVLDYFQKEDSNKINMQNQIVSTVIDPILQAEKAIYNDEVEDLFKDVKKPAPPPRPPPPTYPKSVLKNVNAYHVANSGTFLNNYQGEETLLTNPDNNIPFQEKPLDNHYPSVFTANEEVPVVSQNTAISSQLSAFDGLGGVLQPATQDGQIPAYTTSNNISVNNNHQLSGALITGDLDSSLASLAENLTIRAPSVVKGVQWNSPKNGSKPGACWSPQPLAATTGAGYKPMNQAMATSPQSMMQPPIFPSNHPVATSPQPMMQQQMFPPVPAMQPMMGVRPIVSNVGMFPPRMGMMAGGAPTAVGMNPMGQQQSLLFN